MSKTVKDVIFLLIGSFVFSLAVNMFVIPIGLGEGGVTGISIILYYTTHLSTGVTNFILNGILLIVGYKFLEKKTIVYTMITIIATSIFLHVTEGWGLHLHEELIGMVFAGVLLGVGIGMILRVGGTTAGSAIIARILNKFLNWKVSRALLIVDLLVVLASYFIIGIEKLLFTIVMLYITTKVIDFVIEGFDAKKAVTVISSNKNEVADQINEQLDRGVTILNGRGNYTKESKEILYVVINKQELIKLKKLIKKIDDEAFVIVHDVRDVIGKGFLSA
ncbi:YitT family protein [Priestia megaterium]|uniref:YitT family protein n=1 Tax=Priestia megaterium TaxID=1404 RepID=UPI001BE70244|nr:YitT family protein [Priestia megaterium]MBT2254838.1 YitT family protein [Priestia megaterium]MBT2278801.1 YitT family protein [Priestia megaterium]MED3931765.1 YitT family protein [Priestia megaterium]